MLKPSVQNRVGIINKPVADQKAMLMFCLTLQACDELNGWLGASCPGAPLTPLQGSVSRSVSQVAPARRESNRGECNSDHTPGATCPALCSLRPLGF